jgi:DNA polymerase III subunit delta
MSGAPKRPSRPSPRRGNARAEAVRPVYLVKGDDPSLVGQAAHVLTERLVGARDPSLVVEEFGGPSDERLDVGAVLDACTTPPFLVDRRVVVVREAGQLTAADASRLVAYLGDPLESTILVLVGGGGAVPPSLSKAVTAAGEVVDASVGSGRARSQWLAVHVREGPVRLDAAATGRLAEHLGEDMGRLAGLLDTLAAAYGEGATVGPEDLEPFLGEAGSVAPWELTDAIDAGDARGALAVLRRILAAGASPPLVVLGGLHRHYRQLLRLDGSGATSADQAAELLGLRSSFPAGKALNVSRRMSTSSIARAVRLLAQADLDVRGTTALPGELVLEVLVARLSRLARQGG